MSDKKTRLDRGIENIAKNNDYGNKLIMKNLLPQKMSAALLDFAKPLLDSIDQADSAAFHSAIKMALVVWNYAVWMDKPAKTPEEESDKESMKARVAKAFSDEIGKVVLKALLDRKKSLYPDNKHGITGFDIDWDDAESSYHLTVTATD